LNGSECDDNKDDFNNGEIAVFPNPANQNLIIKYSSKNGPFKFIIYDSIGQKVFEQTLTDEVLYKSFNIEHLSSGIYYWYFKDNLKKKSIGKFVVIR
jgi:hypothetical protein